MSRQLHVIVVMGVAGAGKTTVGVALAAALGWPFHDADDYHSPENVAKMHRGEGLTDADRESWLVVLTHLLGGVIERGEHAVLACSALKHAYRERLRDAAHDPDDVRFVYLDVPPEVLRERLANRPHHYAPPALLDSQLATLEPPRDALHVDGTCPVAEIVATVRAGLDA